jgi:predicted DNA-binding ribbon-helix-helix protein
MEDQQRRAKRGLPSAIIKRSVKVGGIRTSVSLEDAFWNSLKEIAAAQYISVYELISKIDSERDLDHQPGGLSSALRVFVLKHYRELTEAKRS